MSRVSASMAKAQKPSVSWILLGLAMAASAVWLLTAGRNLSFMGDEIFYYASLVAHGGAIVPAHGIELFLAPHNGHLVLIGRLIYRALFDLVGTNYLVFRVIEVVGVLVCVGLFFVLTRRRVHHLVALAFCISLLFLGYASESLLWPFDLHTVYALAFGLLALLALEQDGRGGDIAACALLILSVATLEVGLAFVVGVAVAVLLRPDRWRRVWIFGLPVALYAVWWLWARKFEQPAITITNIHLIPIDLANALAAVAGSILGLNPTGSGIAPEVTTINAWGTAAAAVAVAGLAVRIKRGQVPRSLWVYIAVVVTYWTMIALGGRPPDSSRYIFVGSLMVMLIVADAIREVRFSPTAIAGVFVVVALAIPPNIAKFYDSRAPRLTDASVSRTEYAMLELARHRVDPEYTPATDPTVDAVGGNLIVPLSAGNYFRAAREFGTLGFPLDHVRTEELMFREVADATLVGALGIRLHQALAPADPSRCPDVVNATRRRSAYFLMASGGTLVGSNSNQEVNISVGRFGYGGSGVSLGKLKKRGDWATVRTPKDAARDPWWVVVNGPVRVCSLG